MTASALLQSLAGRLLTFDASQRDGLVGRGDPSPIAIEGDDQRPAVLAFHGFAGTPKELRVAADVAAKLGLAARVPRLSGHTANVGDLMNVGWDDWVGDAKRALAALAERANGRVIVGGLSLGALLATHLAATEPKRVAGLFVLAHATWLHFSSFRLPLGVFEKLDLFDNRFYIPKHSADIRDPIARREHLTYAFNPVRSAIEVVRGGRVVRAELRRVTCPTLVVHGRLDRVCPVENAYRFAHELGTGDVTVRIMPGSGHIVTVDVDREEVARSLATFLGRVSSKR
jgi:carboxylesterase